mmetsp:Transcript_876/g.1744  ORF Transcript_876/g.1744 Transcript_876/m.1744 type:complete len:1390 (+) Transcript_876:165-4334(+)|eukprot:CAMPEP_0168727042 /NCGR_PEP_ID=MMETSP0724-20121128/4976_1 /TAXON_ID=265536 /ORGANISM="Amphiprora sp., Strain CCMP467" /LENGTH=1389 /DNA_ID=CAMNT_0008773867 /DNA_START=1391 /DNA_END=5560 /DNA_ORIENTATION=+
MCQAEDNDTELVNEETDDQPVPSDEANSAEMSDGMEQQPTSQQQQHGSKHKEDNDRPTRPPHPYNNASLFSKIFFLWPYPLLQLGMQRPLTDGDLPNVAQVDASQRNLKYIQRLWRDEQERHGDKSDLRRALFRDFMKTLWFIQPFMGAAALAKIIQAVCLGNLIEFFEENDDKENSTVNPNEGYLWAMGLVLCGSVTLFEHHHVFFYGWRKAMQYRVASVAAIYDKALRLSSTHPETLAHYGRILNLASNDVERYMFTTLFVSFLWWAPLQAVGILVTGVVLVGWAFCVGIAVLVILFVPLQTWLSHSFAKFRSNIAAITDQRVNFVSQAVRGARVMKLSGYETQFLERIQEFRALEIHQIQQANRLKAANEALFYATNVVISFVVFIVHVFVFEQELTTGGVFLTFTLVNILQLELIKHVSIAVMTTSECSVSVHRIQQFFSFPEIDTALNGSGTINRDAVDDEPGEPNHTLDRNVAISMQNVSCPWNHVTQVLPKSEAPLQQNDNIIDNVESAATSPQHNGPSLSWALHDATVDFEYQSLTAVIGPVGGGKSALIQALVQELPVTSGSLRRGYKTLAYASQDAWVMDGTIRENITMGHEYNAIWYEEVIQACCLSLDFTQLRDGDQTVVGDRGVQLSGGQRARVGLARALYKNADVLIADDPLSAVDARVGRHLFQHAIMGLSVNKGKCVILATHQHQYVHDARCLLIMDGGHLKCIGTYQDCLAASGGKLTAHDADNSSEAEASSSKSNTARSNNLIEDEKQPASLVEDGEAIKDGEQNEKGKQGSVSFQTYANYVRAMGSLWVGLFILALFIFTQTSVLVTVATMGRWAEREKEDQEDNEIVATVGAMSALVVLLAIFRAYLCFELTAKASQKLHDQMAASVLRAKIEFFDTNPMGRILNRFSADVGVCDDQLPQTMFDFLMIAFIVFGAVITALATLPFALAILPFLVWYFAKVRSIFVTSTRELKRLEGLARSPIFALLSEALGGIATIRANDYLEYFRKKFYAAHDGHTRTFFMFLSASRWLGFRMDSIVFTFMATVSFLAVVVQNEGWFHVDPAILGLSISMLIYLSGVFQWCIRQSAEVVNQMVSVERVLEYGHLESEAPLICEGDNKLKDSGWPSAGEIEYNGVSVRYRSTLPLALRKISFRIPAGARVGVVGRTGSGKSTVVQTLFRLLEPEDGKILIDSQDISKMGLHTLRTKISVIPQVPTLFSGCTVRENLDLFGLHSDEAIAQVLKSCHLMEAIEKLSDGTNSIVSEGGSNFSVGQRQLLCLARALLAQNKILVLDEATASVDRRTDQLLQQALQESYQDGTILAVAHRLDTIIDYDFILVLGQGEVLEFGTPDALLSQTEGIFTDMVQDTGDTMSKSLREQAHESQARKKLS